MRRGRRRRPWLRSRGYEPVGKRLNQEARREGRAAAAAIDILDRENAREKGLSLFEYRRRRSIEAGVNELFEPFYEATRVMVFAIDNATKQIAGVVEQFTAAFEAMKRGAIVLPPGARFDMVDAQPRLLEHFAQPPAPKAET